MSDNYHIKYIKRDSIDTARWDRCIDEAQNGLIYAYSFYLDNMASHWDALILNDYEAVMPVTWNKKWGIKYLYQPALTPQLGIFSASNISEELVDSFIRHIDSRYRFAEIFLNFNNHHHAFKPHDNYVLNLSKPYAELSSVYEKDLIKNLKRAGRFQFIYTSTYNLEEALSVHKQQYQGRTPDMHEIDYTHFQKLCYQLQHANEAIIRAILNEENELLSIVLLLQKKERIYLIESTTTNEGREMQANHFLLDAIIQEFAGKNITLDFVGSDIPGIAHFYKNFGPVNQPYFFLRFNNLPWLIRLFKKK
jgi:hypothetical protein